MADPDKTTKEIFLSALDIAPHERPALLDSKCAGDAVLRKEVEELLRIHDEPDSFLDGTRIDLGLTDSFFTPVTEGPGDTIGPYKLLQQVGEGGMGVVFMAEQSKPIERRVALKVIKAGMDTKHVIARFEAERQALAMMDHPNISKVFDAGTTATGRPYFVMELVKGVPITEYCDEHHLTPNERLELFLPVCHAVQHAHLKGVIHRDLKPSNVLVAHYDDQPVPKVIDFGVAKAIEHRLTEKTMFTEFGQVLGTVEYMSPEQARLNQWDIDTRSDIYSLGVLLYELLTGETPFDRVRFRKAAFDEVLRVIREEDPPRPSMRLSTSLSLPSIAANRQIEPKKLSALVRGELDWVVMKALEKDRTRRYETASKFAEDVKHYIDDEAVEACPPSAAYKFRKFARRNKPALATLSAVAASLLIGAGIAISQAVRATEELQRALVAEAAAADEAARADEEAERANREAENARDEAAIAKAVNDFLNDDLLKQADPNVTNDHDVTMREVVDRAAANVEGRFPDQPLVEASIHQTLGDAYQGLGEYQNAERHIRKALAIRQRELGWEEYRSLDTMLSLAFCQSQIGRPEACEAMAREAIEIAERALEGAEADHFAYRAEYMLAISFKARNYNDQAAPHFRRSMELYEKVHGHKHTGTMVMVALTTSGRDERVKLYREALDLRISEHGEDHVEVAAVKYWLASAVGARTEEGRQLYRETRAVRERVYGPDHPATRDSRVRLLWIDGEDYREAGEFAKAIEKYSEAIDLKPGMHAENNFESRGQAYAAIGEWEKALADYDSAAEGNPGGLGKISGLRGPVYAALGRWDEAVEHLTTSLNQNQTDLVAWLRLLPVLILSGDEATYQGYVEQGAKLIKGIGNTDPEVAAGVCMLAFLRPNDVKVDEGQIGLLDKALNDGSASPEMEPWYWNAKALIAYRGEDAESAVQFASNSQALDLDDFQRAFSLSVLAMAQHRLNDPEEARTALQEATDLIDQLQNNPETRVHEYVLIAMVLLEEAEALIHNVGWAESVAEVASTGSFPDN